jgi:hypothetical protein
MYVRVSVCVCVHPSLSLSSALRSLPSWLADVAWVAAGAGVTSSSASRLHSALSA